MKARKKMELPKKCPKRAKEVVLGNKTVEAFKVKGLQRVSLRRI